MSAPDIAQFALYGESPQESDPRFIHLEALEARSRPSNWTIRPHLHRDLHQIFLVVSGAGDISLDAERHSLSAPLMVLAPAGVVHAFTWPPGSDGYVLTLGDDVFRAATAEHPELAALFDRAAWLEIPDPTEARRMGEDLARFMREAVWRGPSCEAALQGHLLLALVGVRRMLDAAGRQGQVGLDGAARLVAAFRGLIEQRFRTPATIGDYAAALNVTEKSLRNACRRVLGQSPLQQLRRRRALEAQRLLTYSSMTVSEVGYALGFDDPAYFSRAFRADVGQSPADFRRMRGRIRASRP